jgi:tetratricopeptide (TPR) repeat protein
LRHTLAELLQGQDALRSDAEEILRGQREDRERQREDSERLARIEALLAQTIAVPAPFAERAAGAVIAAAAQDQRLALALDRLQLGDIATAEAMFRTVAEETAARIRQDRRDAAVAYRNLGAIAGLRDPKRALDAYAKAVEFDSEDKESLLWLAWLSLDRGALGDAELNFRRVLALANGAGDAWYSSWARRGLGDIRAQRGDLATARREYELATLLRERLATSDPDNAGWQRDLSVSFDRVGDVLVAQGNLPEALRSFRAGLAISERLATSDPDNAGWQRDVAVSNGKLATAYRAAEDIQAARAYLAAGRAIMSELVEKFPEWAQWQRDLAWFDRLLESP